MEGQLPDLGLRQGLRSGVGLSCSPLQAVPSLQISLLDGKV